MKRSLFTIMVSFVSIFLLMNISYAEERTSVYGVGWIPVSHEDDIPEYAEYDSHWGGGVAITWEDFRGNFDLVVGETPTHEYTSLIWELTFNYLLRPSQDREAFFIGFGGGGYLQQIDDEVTDEWESSTDFLVEAIVGYQIEEQNMEFFGRVNYYPGSDRTLSATKIGIGYVF